MSDPNGEHGGATRPGPARVTWGLLALILILGAVLRFHNIGSQSFWDDEIGSLFAARYPVANIVTDIAKLDSSPPLFLTLLRSHYLLVPRTEAWLRALPAAFSVLALVLFFLFARRVAGRWPALAGTFLLAINPLQIYCAQELRYNALALCGVLASMFFFVRLLEKGRGRDLAGYVVATAAAIYTHYFAFFAPLAQTVYVIVLLVGQWRSVRRDASRLSYLGLVALLTASFAVQQYVLLALAAYWAAHRRMVRNQVLWLAGLAVVALCFVPFASTFSYQLLRGVPSRESVSLARSALDLWVYSTVGQNPLRLPALAGTLEALRESGKLLPALLAVLAPFALLVAAGLFDWKKRGAPLLAVVFGAVPLAAALALMKSTSAFDPRYALPYLPAVALLAGKGLVNLASRSRIVLAGALVYVVAVTAPSLYDYYENPAYARQDWRGEVDRIVDRASQGDAILFYDYYVSVPFLYYFDYQLPYYYLFNLFEDLKRPVPERIDHLAGNMDRFTGRHERLWLFDYHGFILDPLDDVRRLLAERGYDRIGRDCRYSGLHRWCVDLFSRDASEVEALYASMVDFEKGGFLESQVQDGWYRSGGMRWTAASATATVKIPRKASEAEAVFYVNYGFHGGEPFDVSLSVNDVQVDRFTVTEDAFVTLSGPLPEGVEEGDFAALTLTSGSTFVPAEVMTSNDRTDKALLVRRIGVR